MSKELYTLTTLKNYLNDRFKVKKSGEPFRISDVQQYVKRGRVPYYLGNIEITKEPSFPMNLYTLIEKTEKNELGQ